MYHLKWFVFLYLMSILYTYGCRKTTAKCTKFTLGFCASCTPKGVEVQKIFSETIKETNKFVDMCYTIYNGYRVYRMGNTVKTEVQMRYTVKNPYVSRVLTYKTNKRDVPGRGVSLCIMQISNGYKRPRRRSRYSRIGTPVGSGSPRDLLVLIPVRNS